MGKRWRSSSDVTVGVGAAALMVACCWVLPALLAGGVLGAIGGLFGNPLVIAAGVTGSCGGLAAALVHGRRGGQERSRGSDKDRGFDL
jgi:hypothetical protein